MSAGRIVVPLILVAAALGLLVAGAAVPVVAVVALRRVARPFTTDHTRGVDAADREAGRSVSSDARPREPPRLRSLKRPSAVTGGPPSRLRGRMRRKEQS